MTGPVVSAVVVAVVVVILVKTRSVGRALLGLVAMFVVALVVFPPDAGNSRELPDNPDGLNAVSWLWKEFREDLSGGGEAAG